MTTAPLKVTSHVGRDILQSAQLFKHENAVVWEYVSNGLQYRDPGVKPTAIVTIDAKAKKITIADNGRGMLLPDLTRYFKMHGENLDRKQGRPGRGYFGTGKSAAFGIAYTLRITTVRDKKRSKVELTRAAIDAQVEGDEIPLNTLEQEVTSSASNGTLIEIEDIFIKQLDVASVISQIERHIAHWPDATVIVNKHLCEFLEPPVNEERKFTTKGSEYEQTLGDTELVIKIAKAPVEDAFKGIAVVSDGVWHETTLAGCERKPFVEYLFGSFDVPALSRDTSGVPAFDMSRSMKLNPRNEVVADTMRFIGMNLEAVRRELETKDRERRKTEDEKRLQKQAAKIAELINQHFKEWKTKLQRTIAKAGTGRDLLPVQEENSQSNSAVKFGKELPAIVLDDAAPFPDGPSPWPEPNPNPNPLPGEPRVELMENAEEKLAKETKSRPKKTAAGGFSVEFKNIGSNEKRAKYDRDTRTIFVNLEHPRIALEMKSAGGKSPVDDPNFVRMAYEIAFTEYAIVLAQELSAEQYYYDPQDALVEVRQTLDDLSKVFASAWAAHAITG